MSAMVSKLHNTTKKVLVTGGAGFIGSHLTEFLTRSGSHVVVVDDMSTGSLSNLTAVDSGKLTIVDATVAAAISTLDPHEFNAIYHLAAAVGVRLVIDEPIGTIETNVLETSAILNFASVAALPILIASTSEVYGKSEKQPFAENDDVVYGCTRYSRWSYACSKAIDEYLALGHYRNSNLPVRIIRFFNTVGPRQVGHYGMVLPRFVRAALHGQAIEVYGDGKQSRCFCDVRDVVAALPKVMNEPSCAGQVFNLGNDKSISISDLAEFVCRTLGCDVPIRLIPYDQAYGPGFDDLRRRQPDLRAIQTAIGFEAAIPLEQTIRDIAEHMQRTGDDTKDSKTRQIAEHRR